MPPVGGIGEPRDYPSGHYTNLSDGWWQDLRRFEAPAAHRFQNLQMVFEIFLRIVSAMLMRVNSRCTRRARHVTDHECLESSCNLKT